MRRVILDLTPLSATSALRGIGRYVRGLAAGLAQLEPAEFQIEGMIADFNLFKLTRVLNLAEVPGGPVRAPVFAADVRRNFLISVHGLGVSTDGADLLHLTDPKGIPLSSLPYSLTCHDIISLALPELYLPQLPGWQRLHAGIERFRYTRTCRILAVSHATKRDLCERLEVPPDRVDVVWHGVDHERFQPQAPPGERERVTALLSTSAPYLLYLGAGDARKDLDTLIQAYAQSKAAKETCLVLAGRIPPARLSVLVNITARLGIENSVRFVGYVADDLVPSLYRQSRLHIFPSRYEGFGLPVLEALACGTPTITSPGSALDEVAGDAAHVVPCGEPEALREAMDDLLFGEQRRQALRQRGLERVSRFTWRACAEQTLEFWRRCLA